MIQGFLFAGHQAPNLWWLRAVANIHIFWKRRLHPPVKMQYFENFSALPSQASPGGARTAVAVFLRESLPVRAHCRQCPGGRLAGSLLPPGAVLPTHVRRRRQYRQGNTGRQPVATGRASDATSRRPAPAADGLVRTGISVLRRMVGFTSSRTREKNEGDTSLMEMPPSR